MSDTVISVENLSKRYKIGKKSASYGSLRESLVEAAAAPFHRIKGIANRLSSTSVPRPPSSVDNFIWALKDISFSVQRGEVLGIIGRNGAGKSTLLKILSRITKPTEGRAVVRGRVGSLLEVGTGFHPELTGRENIYLNGAVLGMTRAEIERKFDEIVDFAEIEQFLDTPTKRYSSGMYMRLAFAVASHLETEILLVDEILAVGDYEFQRKCLGKMGNVAQEGKSVLFISHNMGTIISLCQSGIVLQDGILVSYTDIHDAVSIYVNNSETKGVYQRIPDGKYQKLIVDKISILRDGNVTTSFNNSETLNLVVECTVQEKIYGPQIAFELCTELDECIFSSTSQDHSEKEIFLPGKYIFVCPISLHLFREGRYTIRVSASIPSVEILDLVDQYLMFEVNDNSSPMIKLGQGRRGMIINSIRWKKLYYPDHPNGVGSRDAFTKEMRNDL